MFSLYIYILFLLVGQAVLKVHRFIWTAVELHICSCIHNPNNMQMY